MSSLVVLKIKGTDITLEHLQACLRLFNANYGIWSDEAERKIPGLKAGARVKMSAEKLRRQCVANPADVQLATCTINGQLIGHVFTAHWAYPGGVVCWITQLVVSSDHRQQGIATLLLNAIKSNQYTTYGLVSSHPAACLALSRHGHLSSLGFNLEFIKANAKLVLEATTVEYLKTAVLKGSLFEENPRENTVSCMDTNFFVDHEEPLQALQGLKASGNTWTLGDLLDGHEFLLLVKDPKRKPSLLNP